jgi:transcriptional regulator with XRE-family HTH domain
MTKREHLEALLRDFVLRDRRLGDDLDLAAHLMWRDGNNLQEVASFPSRPEKRVISLSGGAKEFVIENKRVQTRVAQEGGYVLTGRQGFSSVHSAVSVPLFTDAHAVGGVLSISSTREHAFGESVIGRVQLFGTIMVYAHLGLRSGPVSSISISLGKALARVREELGLTQSELAGRIDKSRITLSRWESGAQAPGQKALYFWCEALGLVCLPRTAAVTIVDVSPRLLNFLQEAPERLHELSPEQFEHFVAERLDRMGYDVSLTGPTTRRDGGVDLIAVPKVRTLGSFILAGQVKHHQGHQRTGREAVDRLLAWKGSVFGLGLLVTNTAFTRDAVWAAKQTGNDVFLRLRDFEDLRRWLQGNFGDEQDWREIPDQIQLAPGIVVDVPRPKVGNASEIWPAHRLDLEDA